MSQRNWDRDPHAGEDDSSWSITTVAGLVAVVVTTLTWIYAVNQFLGNEAAVARFLADTGAANLDSAFDPAGAQWSVTVVVTIVMLVVGVVGFYLWLLRQGILLIGGLEVVVIFVAAPAVMIGLLAMVATRALLMIPHSPRVLVWFTSEQTLVSLLYLVLVTGIVLGGFWMKRLESQMNDPNRRRRRRR